MQGIGNLDLADAAYNKAVKSAQKAARAAQQAQKNPYLPALEEFVPDLAQLSRVSLGIIAIPMSQIVGTATLGRTPAFACNFMPLLDEASEFAQKWRILYQNVVQSGVREPVKVLEYMNKFYAIEGNKRISVSRYLDSPVIEADVTRVVPRRTDDKENRIYYEFMDFYNDTGIIDLTFSEEGSYARITELAGQKPGVKWSDDAVMDFRAGFHRFIDAYQQLDEDHFKITPGDAFLIYLQAFGYSAETLSSTRIGANLNRMRNEIRTIDQDEPISLKLTPDGQKPGIIRQIIHGTPALSVCFINNRAPEISGWTYWHELGKNHIDSVFDGKIKTQTVNNVAPADCQAAIESAVKGGANIIFTTSPVLLDGAMKAAMQLPHAKILNCSLLPVYNSVRSYYLRMYEAKFVLGAIAGAVCDNNRIGYIADYPVFGTAASINAFALGARLSNPRAQIYLEWSTVKDRDPEASLEAQNVRVICNRDIAAPSHQSTVFGLYMNSSEKTQNLAMPVWNWGRLYEDLLRRIQNGYWDTDTSAKNAQALSYWWGMDVGAIDVFYSKKLDTGTRRLTNLLRDQLTSGSLKPFADVIRSQDGVLRCEQEQSLTPAQIIAMDWLCDNVIGSIPDVSVIRPEALPFVELQGLQCTKAPDISEIHWAEPGKS